MADYLIVDTDAEEGRRVIHVEDVASVKEAVDVAAVPSGRVLKVFRVMAGPRRVKLEERTRIELVDVEE